jgi:hypothetical protein
MPTIVLGFVGTLALCPVLFSWDTGSSDKPSTNKPPSRSSHRSFTEVEESRASLPAPSDRRFSTLDVHEVAGKHDSRLLRAEAEEKSNRPGEKFENVPERTRAALLDPSPDKSNRIHRQAGR